MVACLSIKCKDLVDALYCVQVCAFSLTRIKGWCVSHLAGYYSTSLGRLKKGLLWVWDWPKLNTKRPCLTSHLLQNKRNTLFDAWCQLSTWQNLKSSRWMNGHACEGLFWLTDMERSILIVSFVNMQNWTTYFEDSKLSMFMHSLLSASWLWMQCDQLLQTSVALISLAGQIWPLLSWVAFSGYFVTRGKEIEILPD